MLAENYASLMAVPLSTRSNTNRLTSAIQFNALLTYQLRTDASALTTMSALGVAYIKSVLFTSSATGASRLSSYLKI